MYCRHKSIAGILCALQISTTLLGVKLFSLYLIKPTWHWKMFRKGSVDVILLKCTSHADYLECIWKCNIICIHIYVILCSSLWLSWRTEFLPQDGRKDTCELRLNEGRVKLVHLSGATVQEHDVDNVISDVPLPLDLHDTNTHCTGI
jgi:hypothetical protein